MPEYIVRAHSAPTEPGQLLAAVGTGAHVEYLAQVVVNSLFVAKGHRSDVTLTLVLERSTDFSRALTISGDSLGSLEGMHEAAILEVLADCLHEGRSLGREESIVTDSGIRVSAISFEHLAKERFVAGPVYLLDRKGADIRESFVPPEAVFLLTDHVPMPKKLAKSLVRQGAVPVSLGPTMLHASQCIVLAQNEIDRRA